MKTEQLTDEPYRTTEVIVETDRDGNVVSVWFYCLALPFTQTVADNSRAEEMRRMYGEYRPKRILAIAIEDEDQKYANDRIAELEKALREAHSIANAAEFSVKHGHKEIAAQYVKDVQRTVFEALHPKAKEAKDEK